MNKCRICLTLCLSFVVGPAAAQGRLAFNDGFLNLISSRMAYNAGVTVKILIESQGEKWDNFPPDFRFGIERGLEIAFKKALVSCERPLKQIDTIVDWPRKSDGTANTDSTDTLTALSSYEADYWPILEKWYVQNYRTILDGVVSGNIAAVLPKCESDTSK